MAVQGMALAGHGSIVLEAAAANTMQFAADSGVSSPDLVWERGYQRSLGTKSGRGEVWGRD